MARFLVKTEPSTYSFADLQRDRRTVWDGVSNPVALKHLVHEIRLEDVLGRVILVPVLNPAAFRAGTRESTLDDGVNLNRAFVDGAGKTPALPDLSLQPALDFAQNSFRLCARILGAQNFAPDHDVIRAAGDRVAVRCDAADPQADRGWRRRGG